MDCSFLPGGLAMTSMPDSSGSSSSEQHEVGLAFFAEEFLEHLAEVDPDLGEGFGEQALGFRVDAFDDFEQLGFRGDEVVVLVLEEVVAFFEFLEFLDGVEVDRAHGIEAAFDVGDDGFDEIPVRLAGHLTGDLHVVLAGAIDDHGGHVVLILRTAVRTPRRKRGPGGHRGIAGLSARRCWRAGRGRPARRWRGRSGGVPGSS